MKATIYDSFEDLSENGVPGAIHYLDSGLAIRCPGCGKESCLPTEPGMAHQWNWDGNKESPTLTPSVHSVGCCGWHGYLRKGIWESC